MLDSSRVMPHDLYWNNVMIIIIIIITTTTIITITLVNRKKVY